MLFTEEYEEIAREIDLEEKTAEARKEGREEGMEIILNALLQKGYITEEVVKEFSELPL